jgi:methylthioribose-1-phosphate isomerase
VDAIRTLAVRGAPAIGIAAAYALVVCMSRPPRDDEPGGGFTERLDALAQAQR